MLVNEKTAIIGTDVVLVPYRAEHVPTYHKWMLSPELRELTASEPLTLDEEYAMQRKWQTDTDKLTFIILARPHLLSISGEANSSHGSKVLPHEKISALPMVGDVNLFLKETPEDGDEEVEAEVMVAELEYRRKGVALAALQVLFDYATSPDGPLRLASSKIVARIGETNHASLRLFESLGFKVKKHVPVFQEVEMRYEGDGKWVGGQCITFDCDKA